MKSAPENNGRHEAGSSTPGEAALDHAGGPPATLLLRGAHAFDPRAGIEATTDILVRGGQIPARPGHEETLLLPHLG